MTPKANPQIQLPTGKLSLNELVGILRLLPVQLTYIDNKNKFQFYSGAPVFDRNTAMLGTEAYTCHSSETHPLLTEILETFRNGTHNSATLWHKFRDNQVIFTRYYAVRNDSQEYMGCLAIYQDIVPLQAIKGEQSAPIWDT